MFVYMKEFYIDKNGQKRRLRFSAGDIIMCENEHGLSPLMVTANQWDNTKFGLICLLCSKPVAENNFTKKDLQELLYSYYNVYDVIERKDFRDMLGDKYSEKKISNCI